MTDITTNIQDQKIQEWVDRFRFYRRPPSAEEIRVWISRFEPDHVDLAFKILDNVRIVSEEEIQSGYRSSLGNMEGWSRERGQRQGRWFFVGFGTAGESGPAMVRTFREANNMTQQSWREFFIDFRELPQQRLTAYDHVVFIDDFSGSGSQIVKGWPLVEELVASEAKLFLMLTAITQDALNDVVESTEIEVIANTVLPREDNVISEENTHYTEAEKAKLREYGEIAWARHPCGYKDCGLLFVLSHKTPNNSLPIIHANHNGWVGIFPRNLLRAEE